MKRSKKHFHLSKLLNRIKPKNFKPGPWILSDQSFSTIRLPITKISPVVSDTEGFSFVRNPGLNENKIRHETRDFALEYSAVASDDVFVFSFGYEELGNHCDRTNTM